MDEQPKKPSSLDSLDEAIAKARKDSIVLEKTKQKESNTGSMLRVGVELVSATTVGSFIGYFLDKWIGTFPLFFITCFILGVGASMLNMYRSFMKDVDEDDSDNN